MKFKIPIAILLAFSLLACTNEKKFPFNSTTKTEGAHGHLDGEEAPADGLTLNNGNKWQTDESTWLHAVNLNALVAVFETKEDSDIESYHGFAANMQEELGGLVKDCKMKGADHDALHLWLEPVMKDVNDLKKTATADEGKQIAETLTANVKKFDKYFKYAH